MTFSYDDGDANPDGQHGARFVAKGLDVYVKSLIAMNSNNKVVATASHRTLSANGIQASQGYHDDGNTPGIIIIIIIMSHADCRYFFFGITGMAMVLQEQTSIGPSLLSTSRRVRPRLQAY